MGSRTDSPFNGTGAWAPGHGNFGNSRVGFNNWHGNNWGWRGGWGGWGWRGGWGCCGFGWGWGWGWRGFGIGFGWNPWWGWGPGWGGYWAPSWPAYWSYTYPPVPYAYPSDDVNGSYDDSSYNSGASNDSPSSNVGAELADNYENPSPVTGNVAESTPTALLYLNDGTVFLASDYWVADNRLHFRVDYGGESTMGIDQLDWARTVDENAKRNIRFALKLQPDDVVLDPATSALNTDSGVVGDNASPQDAGFNNLMQPGILGFTFATQSQWAPQTSGSS
jgi:hypothetical protein